MSEGKLEHDIDRWISKVTTVRKTKVLQKKRTTHFVDPHSCVCACAMNACQIWRSRVIPCQH